MTALQVIEGFRAVGGRLIAVGSELRWESLIEPPPALIEAAKERKADLLVLLLQAEGRCPAGHPPYYWQDAVGQWHCGDCEPDPRAHIVRGVTPGVLGNRAIAMTPPAGDLAAPGSWARTPAGELVELVLYREDGGEALVRALPSERLAWFDPATLLWEIDWSWNDAKPSPAPDSWKAGTLCPTCVALRWQDRAGNRRCDCDGLAAAELRRRLQ